MGISYVGGVTLPQGSGLGVIKHPTWVTNANLGTVNGNGVFNVTLSATPGFPDEVVVYSLGTFGSVPSGLSLDANTGVLNGTVVNNPGTYQFDIRAGIVGKSNVGTAKRFTLIVANQGPVWTTAAGALTAGFKSIAYSTSVAATDPNSDTVTFSITSGTLPAGLSFNTSTGDITGTPTTAQTASFEITANDGKGGLTARTFSILVYAANITWTQAAGAIGSVNGNSAITPIQLASESGLSGDTMTYSLVSGLGNLPTGLSMTTAGYISGTAVNNPATYTFTVRATSGMTGVTNDRQFSIAVVNQQPIWSTASGPLPVAYQNRPYTTTLSATDPNTDGVTYTVSTGSTLPAGMSLNGSTGVISGSASSFGLNTFDIDANDSNGGVTTRSFSIDVITAAVTWTTAAGLLRTVSGNFAISTTNLVAGTAIPSDTITYAKTTGSLPSGLSLSAGGAITGTAVNTPGTYTFTIRATSGLGGTFADQTFTIDIVNQAPVWTTAAGALTAAYSAKSYNVTLAITDNNADTISFAITSGAIPPGMTFNGTTGAIAGTPTHPAAIGTANFTVTASDGKGGTADRAFSILVNDSTPTFTTAAGSLGSVPGNSTCTFTVRATSAVPSDTFTYAVTAGAIPAGTSFSSSGNFSGSATNVYQTSSFTVRATSGLSGLTVSEVFSIDVTNQAPNWTTAAGALTSGHPDTAYSKTLVAVDPNGTSVTYAVTAGALPTGLSMTTGGVISGTPTTLETANFTVTVSDSYGASTDRAFSIAISNAAPTFTTAAGPLTEVIQGQAYSYTLIGTDGDSDILTYAVTSGTLPTGLSLSSGGVISGTPSVAEIATFDVTVSDPWGGIAVRSFSINVVTNQDAAWQNVVLATKFDGANNGTTFTDILSNTMTAAGSAMTTTSTFRYGTASGMFNGTNAYVSVPNSTSFNFGTNDYTIECWIKTSQSTATTLIGNYANTTNSPGWSLNMNAGKIYMYHSDGSAAGATSTPSTGLVNDNTWKHIAVTRIGSSIKYWINGVLDSTVTLTNGINSSSATSLNIGANTATTPSSFFNGYMDDLRITNGTARYSSTFTPSIYVVGPAWTTAAALANGIKTFTYSSTQTASGTGITYSKISDTLQAGLSWVGGSTSTISGTPTTLETDTITLTATDSYGNYYNRVFSIIISSGTIASGTGYAVTNQGSTFLYSYDASGTRDLWFGFDAVATIQCWGAAGGFGRQSGGAAGGYTITKTTIPANTTLKLMVGQGGSGNGTYAAYGYGSTANYQGAYGYPGGGGGLSGVFNGSITQANALSIAGGGGGASNYTGLSGAGGGTSGGNGSGQYGTTTGGSPSAVGYGTGGGSYGSGMSGGTGSVAGGGGGGGYWGGGGGSAYSGGGGGSGYTPPTIGSATYTSSGATMNSNGTSATGYTAGIGVPVVASYANGGHGQIRIVISQLVWKTPEGALTSYTKDSAYSFALDAADLSGNAITNYAVTSGSLPPGLSLNATTGEITGTPTVGGTWEFTVTVTDFTGTTVPRIFKLSDVTANIISVIDSVIPSDKTTKYNILGNVVTFRYTGAYTDLSFPSDAILKIQAWGAGGGFGKTGGGAGAYSVATVAVTGGTPLKICVGQGGSGGGGYAAFGFGSTGGNSNVYGNPGGGGGLSGVFANSATQANAIIIAAGGGGGANYSGAPGAGDQSGKSGGAGNMYGTNGGTGGGGGGGGYTGGTGGGTYTGGKGGVSYVPVGSGNTIYAGSGTTMNAAGTSATGYISGVGVHVVANNANGGNGLVRITISNLAWTTPAGSIGTYTTNSEYTDGVVATGATSFAVTNGALPTGLSLNTSTGAITGTPTAGGTWEFTITATDNDGLTLSRIFKLNSTDANVISVSDSSTPTNGATNYSILGNVITFRYSGIYPSLSFTNAANVTVQAWGASGGFGKTGGGAGAYVIATMNISQGNTLAVCVGQGGSGGGGYAAFGFGSTGGNSNVYGNPGGGGGLSGLFLGSVTFANRLIIAAGGGGGANYSGAPGAGDQSGKSGGAGDMYGTNGGTGGGGGGGGSVGGTGGGTYTGGKGGVSYIPAGGGNAVYAGSGTTMNAAGTSATGYISGVGVQVVATNANGNAGMVRIVLN